MKKVIAIALALVMLLGLCACAASGDKKTNDEPAASADAKKTIGILMPTKEQTIWSIQGERLTAAFENAGYATQIEYAEDDSAKQAMQIENMITKGVNALVIVAVDCAALTDACEKAKDAGIYVIAEDRLITNTEAVDYYITFDLTRMGELQGQYIVDTLDLENQDGPTLITVSSLSSPVRPATRRPQFSPGTPPRRSPVWITCCPAIMQTSIWTLFWSLPTASHLASSLRWRPWATARPTTPIPSSPGRTPSLQL